MAEPNTPDERTRARPNPAPSDAPTGAFGASATGASGPSASASQKTPVQIGRFEVRRLLGEGAFARVYLGFDSELEREVAIKVPKSDELTPEFRDAFIRENRLAAIIHHANICPIFEVGTDGSVPFIVMRFIPDTLAGLLRRITAPMSAKTAVAITRKLAQGLVAAHAQKVIHRDLKPANVLYDEASREVLIADFGLARFVDQATAASNGVPKGTPAYMSPEQARGLADQIGPHSDVYALGVILYEMLTGRAPFKGSVWEVMRDHCETPPAAPSSVRPSLDSRLDAIVLKAMAKAPADRYHSAKDFADALAGYLRAADTVAESGTVPTGPTAPPPLPPPPALELPPDTSERGSREPRDGKKSGRKRRPGRPREPEAAPRQSSVLKWLLVAGGIAGAGFVLLVALAVGSWLMFSKSPSPTTAYKSNDIYKKTTDSGSGKGIK